MDATHAMEQDEFSRASSLEMLKRDHRRIRQLFDQYLNAPNTEGRKGAGTELIGVLETHSNLEEAVFYPVVRKLDPAQVDGNAQEHREVRQLIQEIKNIDMTHPQCEQLFRLLADTVLSHIDKEEQLLFPKVQQSGMDSAPLWIEMQAYLSTSVSTQAKSVHPDRRRQ
jgi:hemerythrin superfamily protein